VRRRRRARCDGASLQQQAAFSAMFTMARFLHCTKALPRAFAGRSRDVSLLLQLRR
jgi:hypothetical protein